MRCSSDVAVWVEIVSAGALTVVATVLAFFETLFPEEVFPGFFRFRDVIMALVAMPCRLLLILGRSVSSYR